MVIIICLILLASLVVPLFYPKKADEKPKNLTKPNW